MNQQPSQQSGFRIRPHIHRSSSDCRMVEEAIDEYALGILDPAQRGAVDRHLTHCAECAAVVSSYQQTVAVLALAVPLVAPPASASTALMARIAQTSQATPSPANIYAGSLDALRTPTLPSSTPVVPTRPQSQPHQAWWQVYAAPLATLPLLLALGLVAAWGVNNYTQLHDSKNAVAQRDVQIDRLVAQLSNENSQGVANLMASQSAKRYTLTPEVATGSTSAQGVLFADSQGDQAALQVSGLPAGTYAVVVQLQNGDMVPKTEFEVGAQGSATTLINLGTQVTDLKSVHIRATTTVTESDVAAIGAQADALMTLIGPDISDDSDTSIQKP